MAKFVCAFRGRRDGYQVPLALDETGQLEAFVTDAYLPDDLGGLISYLPARLGDRARARKAHGLDGSKIRCLWGTALLEQMGHILRIDPSSIYGLLDRQYSRVAGNIALKEDAGLLLYSPYAWEAFSDTRLREHRKILFQYHPHHQVESSILETDYERNKLLIPGMRPEILEGVAKSRRRREDSCWSYADAVICASEFTASTLLQVGADPSRLSVVPYGIDMPPVTGLEPKSSFNVLFAGSGIQRKGLHHLLLAWQKVAKTDSWKLTLVCRSLEKWLRALVEATPRVSLVHGVTSSDLATLYENATLFAMPSLVEGFGQVFLESLSFGTPVLGTDKTCLPDLGDENDGIFRVKVGEVDQLAQLLNRLFDELPRNRSVRVQARACASRHSWSQFRAGVRKSLAAI